MVVKIEMGGGIHYQRGDLVRIIIKTCDKEGHEQKENRPAIVVQNDISNKFLETTVVIPVTEASNIKKLGPNHVFLKAHIDGVSIDSVALCHQITAADVKKRISAKIGCIPKPKMSEIDAALKVTLGID